ncbi:MAG TPA: hypothetical protein VN034_07200 [Sphingopyxis sp.]|nr:hypothetical protein [Sphingopyxis sp.]
MSEIAARLGQDRCEEREEGIALGGAFGADQAGAGEDRAVLAILRPGTLQRPQREALAHFRGIEGRGGKQRARQRIDLALAERDGGSVRRGGHDGSYVLS